MAARHTNIPIIEKLFTTGNCGANLNINRICMVMENKTAKNWQAHPYSYEDMELTRDPATPRINLTLSEGYEYDTRGLSIRVFNVAEQGRALIFVFRMRDRETAKGIFRGVEHSDGNIIYREYILGKWVIFYKSEVVAIETEYNLELRKEQIYFYNRLGGTLFEKSFCCISDAEAVRADSKKMIGKPENIDYYTIYDKRK